MGIRKGTREERNLAPRGAGCTEGRLPQTGGSSKPLEIPSDFSGTGQEREGGADAAAGELPPRPP